MEATPLHHVWNYTDVDRAFWEEHLERWVPRRIVDAHTHLTLDAHRIEPMTEERRRQYWVSETSEPMDAPTAERCDAITFPNRTVTHVAIAWPDLAFDVEAGNEYARAECLKRGWHALTLLRPEWSAARVAAELDKPGVIGLKPYYTLLGYTPATRDKYLEASIFDYLPHRALEVLDDRHGWLTLHVPKADRLPHPDNVREIQEIRKRYPNISVVIAHFGRCYTEPHAREALPLLGDDAGLYFDNSAVLNPAVHRIALKYIGPERILYGTDNPVFYMRGRRQWHGRAYLNRTSYPFHFNKERESPEIEARYTLYMYEALRAIKEICVELGIVQRQVEAMFHGNAERLIQTALAGKRAAGPAQGQASQRSGEEHVCP